MSMLNENEVLKMVKKILSEEVSKVNRVEYNRVKFKIDELQSQINETLKEFRKLQDSIPDGLKTITNSRLKTISENLQNASSVVKTLKFKIDEHKKSSNKQDVLEKKK